MIRSILKEARLLHIFLIIILGFTVYANSLKGEFIWDDNAFVKNNAYIKDWRHIPDILTKSTASGAGYSDDLYRPFQTFTYLIDNSIWKGNLIGYHLTNILLHVLVSLAIYWLVILLFSNRTLAWVTSVLFIVHPVQTEAVSYISGRGDLLSALFMLLCIIFYIIQLGTRDWRLFIIMLSSYTLSILSKENAIILPVLLLLYHYVFKNKIKLRLLAPIVGIAFFYLLLRPIRTTALLFDFNIFLKRIPGFFVAITNYLRILFLPIDLHMEYGNRLFRFMNPKAIFGFVASFILLSQAFKKSHTNKLFVFSVCWFFIALLPHSSVYPVCAFYMAEHWLYFSSLGFFLILASLALLLYNRNKSKIYFNVLIICLVSIFSFLSISQNKYWNNQISFYKRTLKYTPDSARIYNNLCQAYIAGANYSEAVKACRRAIDIKSNFPEAYCNLGDIYKELGNNAGAEVSYNKAIKINPKFTAAYFQLGELYSSTGKNEEAIKEYEHIIEIDPGSTDAYNRLCEIYLRINDNVKALQICKKSLQFNSGEAIRHYNLGRAYDNLGEKQNAIEAYSKAIKINPNYLEAYNNIASVYADTGAIEKAIELWNKIIEIDKNFAVAHFNLAVFYFKQKKFDLAIKHCDKGIELGNKVDPKFLGLLKPYRK